MKRVDAAEDLRETVEATENMAAKAFGDGTVYLEKLIDRPRHIEIQVFGFGDGRAVHYFERECSIQRRFQKIVEESPAPGLAAEIRDAMAEAAVALAKAETEQRRRAHQIGDQRQGADGAHDDGAGCAEDHRLVYGNPEDPQAEDGHGGALDERGGGAPMHGAGQHEQADAVIGRIAEKSSESAWSDTEPA